MPIQFDFSGKGVFVTDSAIGLGRRIAEAFYELGARVAIHDALPLPVANAVRELGGGSRLVAAPGDLAKTSNVEGILQTAINDLGRLDVLVCCPAQGSPCSIDNLDEEYFER